MTGPRRWYQDHGTKTTAGPRRQDQDDGTETTGPKPDQDDGTGARPGRRKLSRERRGSYLVFFSSESYLAKEGNHGLRALLLVRALDFRAPGQGRSQRGGTGAPEQNYFILDKNKLERLACFAAFIIITLFLKGYLTLHF